SADDRFADSDRPRADDLRIVLLDPEDRQDDPRRGDDPENEANGNANQRSDDVQTACSFNKFISLVHRASAGAARVATTAARAGSRTRRRHRLAFDAGGKDRELFLKPLAGARRTLDDRRAIDDGFKLMRAGLAEILENRHRL